MRKTVIAGNWKMNTDRSSGAELAAAVMHGAGSANLPEHADVVLCPPFVVIPIVANAVAGSRIRIGAQNVHDQPRGAFTGEISTGMLHSVGCTHVIVGHSERRLMFAESDYDVCRKANAVVGANLQPIICVGETIAEREQGRTLEVVRRQLRAALDGIFEFSIRTCIIAYEPIWAIGTGNTATPGQAQEVHAFIRSQLREMYGSAAAEDVSVIYGGSVTETNACDLFAQPDIDGGLVGGASLDASAFTEIIRAAI
ncbi:MAG: triose-phosphate isomerase [Bacteroidetes bacterium]|nr:triose-phosphate isomerase [Bacteroidota bacterium]